MQFLPSLLVYLLVAATVHCQAVSVPSQNAVYLRNGIEHVLIQPWGNNSVRIRSSLYRSPTGQELGAVLDPPVGVAAGIGLKTERTITFNDTNVIVQSGMTSVNITGGKMIFSRVTGNNTEYLFQELWPKHGLNARYWDFQKAGVTSRGSPTFTFSTDDDEQIFGLGQHQTGKLDNKGQEFEFRHYQSELTLPFYTSSKAYSFLWNVPSMGSVSVRQGSIRWISDSTTVADYVITVAEPGRFESLLDCYTRNTGRVPHLPRFAQGYIQSKNRYTTQNEIIRVANGFAQRGIQVSMLVIDFYNWAFLGDWSFNRTSWPDPVYMTSYVKNCTGAEMMVSAWPLVQSESPNWYNMSMLGLLTGSSEGTGVIDRYLNEFMQLIDPFNPDTRSFVWSKLKQNYYDLGVRHFWLDSDEGGSVGEGNLFKSADSAAMAVMPYSRPNSLYSQGSQPEVGAAFPYFEQKMISEGVAETQPDAFRNSSIPTTISLSRSAWLGSQSLGSIIWNGDVDSSWDVFPIQIIGGLNAQMSGVPWWTTDIGGFYVQPNTYFGNISDPKYQQLYVRWFEYGTFCPIMRAHGTRNCIPAAQDNFTNCPNEPWSYGPQNEAILTKYIRLRYELANYIDAFFGKTAISGLPPQRPLFFDFARSDPHTLRNTEAFKYHFMFGPNILVAPVVTRDTYNISVYLPDSNTLWKNWWDNSTVRGGQSVTVPTPIETIPVFYRGTKEDIYAGKLWE